MRWCRRNPRPASRLGWSWLVFLCLLAGRSSRQCRGPADGSPATRSCGRRRRPPPGTRADAARDEAKQTRNAAARQAAGLLLDQGIEDARGGEPARALHLFVQALRTLPADDPEAAPLERVIRANLSAWAETVPALEHIWPGGVAIRRRRLHSRRRSDRHGRREGRGPVLPDRHRPAGRPADQDSRRVGVRRWRSRPTAGASGSRRPAERRWSNSGPFTGSTRRRVARSSRRSRAAGRSIASSSPRTGGTSSGRSRGLHPEDAGRRGGRGADPQVANGVDRGVGDGDGPGRPEGGRERRAPTRDRERSRPDAYLSLSPDGKSVTAWVQRGANRFEGMTFTVEGNEPPIRRELPAVGSDAPLEAPLPEQHADRAGDQGRPASPLVRHRTRRARSRRPDPLPLHALRPVGGRPIRDLPDRGPGLRHRGLAAPAVRRALRPPGMAAVPECVGGTEPGRAVHGDLDLATARATGDSGGSPGPTAGPRSRPPNRHGNRNARTTTTRPSSTRAGRVRSSGRQLRGIRTSRATRS